FHNFALTTEGTDRQTAADDFAQTGHVRHDAVVFLRATEGGAEATHYFIENQHNAMHGAELTQALQEAFGSQHAVHVAGHRLNDHAGNFIAHVREAFFHAVEVVVVQGNGVGGHGSRYARRSRYA